MIQPRGTGADLLSKAREMMEWQPIETAPKDGSSVLCVFANGGIQWCRWVFNHRTKTTFWNDSTEWDDYENETNPPTHWIELPPYPKSI